jgi:multimeric flavodoxin WrbA
MLVICINSVEDLYNRREEIMKIIALIGSPRKNGNTDIMADELLRGASDFGASVDKIYLDDFYIRPIAEVCDKAAEREDTRSDDDFPALLEKFLDSNIIVMATPVYWFGFSAQLKCFIDRLSSYFRKPPYAQRFDGKGYIVLCAYGRSEEFNEKSVTEPAKFTAETLRGHYLGDVCASNTYQKGKVKQYPDIIESCYKLGYEAPDRLIVLKNKE